MIIDAIPFELNSEDFSEADHHRSPGLHVSQILSELDEIANGPRYKTASNATRQAYFSIGFCWERILSQVWAETAIAKSAGILVRPGEFRLDGIYLSPDALHLDPYRLEEYKATYLSSNHDINDPCFWVWIKQLQCYCRAVGTRVAILRVWFVVGDWKGSGPVTKAWRFEFTERELDETWAMVLNAAHAKERP